MEGVDSIPLASFNADNAKLGKLLINLYKKILEDKISQEEGKIKDLQKLLV
jgi:hypothetical protein